MRWVALTVAAVALGACQMRPTGDPDGCPAARFADLVGQPLPAAEGRGLPETTRVIFPDTVVTQDFVADRLNVVVGRDGRVAQVACY